MTIRLIASIAVLFTLGAALMAAGHRRGRNPRPQRKADWVKYGIYVVIVCGVILISACGTYAIAGLVLGIAAWGTAELYRNLDQKTPRGFITALSFAAIMLCLGHLLIGGHGREFGAFAFIFLVVSVTDSFSQLWGKLLGSHKLCPKISPGKTVEGLVGGVFTAGVASAALSYLLAGDNMGGAVFYGIAIAGSAVIGDLSFSIIKRKIAIKDFSGIPGCV